MDYQAQHLKEIVKKERENKITVYTISSGKGGVGKSNVAINLAYSLKKLGKKVLIVDSDFGFANVCLLLGVNPTYTIQDIFQKGISLEDVIINVDDIKILPGGNDLFDFSSISEQQNLDLQTQFSRLNSIDTIIVDTSGGISKIILSYIMFSHETILVTTPEVTAITDVYSMLKNIDALKLKQNVKIIVNKAKNEFDAISTYDKLKRVTDKYLRLNISYLGFIPEDTSVCNSVREQVPYVELYPRSKATSNTINIARTLSGENNKVKGSTITDIYTKLSSIFGG